MMTAAALGCGSSSSSGGSGGSGGGAGTTTGAGAGTTTGSGGSGGTPSTAIKCDGAPADLSLGGTWVAKGELTVKLNGIPGGAITICPADQEGAANMLLMITIEQNATDPTKLDKISASLCSLDLPVVTALVGNCDPSSPALVSTQIIAPQTFIDALPKIATTPVTGTLGGTAAGAAVDFGQIDVTVGSSKSAPNLPKWDSSTSACKQPGVGNTSTCATACVSDCASMRDDDGDGFPGATVDVCGYSSDDTKKGVQCHADTPNVAGSSIQGRAFLDIEVNPKFSGSAVSSCELTGTVDAQVLYNVVGADVYLGGAPIAVSSAIASLPQFTVQPQDSKLRLVRIDGQYGAPDLKVDPTNPIAACKTINMNVNQF